MKKVDTVLLICLFSSFIFFKRVDISQDEVATSSFEEKRSQNIPALKKISSHARYQSTMILIQKHEETHSIRWDDDIKFYLENADPHHGTLIYKSLMEEKLAFERTLNNHLNIHMRTISSLNGESGIEVQDVPDITEVHNNHHHKVKTILGDHYDYFKIEDDLE